MDAKELLRILRARLAKMQELEASLLDGLHKAAPNDVAGRAAQVEVVHARVGQLAAFICDVEKLKG